MNALIKAVAIAAVIAAPLSAFAQSNDTVTRAQVNADLVRVQQAGYSKSRNAYPADIQAAESRVQSQDGVAQTSGVGGVTDGSSQGGVRSTFTASSYSAPVAAYGKH
jgi:hypothetical protein